jgi:hypothetical protein
MHQFDILKSVYDSLITCVIGVNYMCN